MHYVRHLAQILEHCPPRYTGEKTLCYRDGLLSKMTPASVLIYAKSTFDSWQCAMNFTILFLSVAIVTFGNLALCLLIIQSPLSSVVVGGGHDGAHDSNPGTENCKDHMMVWVAVGDHDHRSKRTERDRPTKMGWGGTMPLTQHFVFASNWP